MIVLPKLFDYWAKFRPDNDALVCEDTRYSWAEVHRMGRSLAAELQRRDVRPGDRVGILLANSAEWGVAYVGLTMAGAVLVPLNPRFGSFELRAIEGDADCTALITTRGAGASLSERFDLGEGGQDSLLVASRHDAGEAPADLMAVFAAGDTPVPVTVAPQDLTAIFYTSGSTGLPKGTMQTHATILSYVFSYTAGLQFTSEDRALIVAPLAFTGGCLSLLIPMMLIGACCVIERSYDPARILMQTEKERISFMTQVPAIWDRMPDLPGWAGADLSSLRVAMTGGAPVPVSLLERFREKGVRIRQVYGCTEIGAMACFPPFDLSMRRPETVGYPLPTLTGRVVKDGRDCAPGEVGEFWLKGSQVMTGYWRNPELTETAFEDGYYKTGDLVKRDEDGAVVIVDRLKNMIISGGVNIYPAEIERALASLDCIEECGVFGVEDAQWGERVVAVIHGTTAIDMDAIRVEVRGLLGALKTPRELIWSSDPLPKTVTNKIARTELAALYVSLTGAEIALRANTL
ncbi:MAG TPA: AMP-binding protein [Sphingobium sp.]